MQSEKITEGVLTILVFSMWYIVSFFWNNFGIENGYILKILQTIFEIIIVAIYICVAKPVIKFEYKDREPLKLQRKYPEERAKNITLRINTEFKFILPKKFLKILSFKPSKNFYRLYWKPLDAIFVKANEDYKSLHEINGYYGIDVSEIKPDQSLEYVFKVLVGKRTECRNVNITIEPFSYDKKILNKLLFKLIRIKAETKTVEIINS